MIADGPARTTWGATFATLIATAASLVVWHFVTPKLIPLRIVEGPMVQAVTATGFELVWYTTDATDCKVEIDPKADVRPSRDGRRHRAVCSNLPAGQAVAYSVQTVGGRVLSASEVVLPSDTDGAMSFIVFGDSGKGTREQYRLAQAMGEWKPDFYVHTGDVVYGSGERAKYASRFFAPYASELARRPFWPSLGNHDLPNVSAYHEVFELPENGPTGLPAERNYWFDAGPCRFVVIDTTSVEDDEDSTLANSIAPWARDVLSEPGPQWRFCVFHHPPFTGGKYEENVRIQETLVPVFEETGVDIVFNGHDHMYQRMRPLRAGTVTTRDEGGVVYVITGAGGARLYEPRDAAPAYVAKMNHAVHSFTLIKIADDTLTLYQLDADGNTLDEWSCTVRTTRRTTTAPAED